MARRLGPNEVMRAGDELYNPNGKLWMVVDGLAGREVKYSANENGCYVMRRDIYDFLDEGLDRILKEAVWKKKLKN